MCEPGIQAQARAAALRAHGGPASQATHTPALLLTSSRPAAGCLPWSQESQSHAALMCGWPLRSAAAMPGEAGSAGSHLARPAVE